MAELTVTKSRILLKGVKDFGSPLVSMGVSGEAIIKSSLSTKAFLVGNSLERALNEDDSLDYYGTVDICGEDTTLQSLSVSGSVNEVEVSEDNTVLKSLEVQVENLTRFNIPESNNYETLKVISSKGGNQSLTLRAKALKVLEVNLPEIQQLSIQECVNLTNLIVYNYYLQSILLNSLSALKKVELTRTSIIDLNLEYNDQLTDLILKSSDTSDIHLPSSVRYVNIDTCNNLTVLDFTDIQSLTDLLIYNSQELNRIILVGTQVEQDVTKMTNLINSLLTRSSKPSGIIEIKNQQIADQIKSLAESKNWTILV